MGVKLADGTFQDRCLDRVRTGEPIFVLRAQDVTSVAVIRYWLEYQGVNYPDKLSDEHRQETLDCLARFEQWQREHPELVKAPD